MYYKIVVFLPNFSFNSIIFMKELIPNSQCKKKAFTSSITHQFSEKKSEILQNTSLRFLPSGCSVLWWLKNTIRDGWQAALTSLELCCHDMAIN